MNAPQTPSWKAFGAALSTISLWAVAFPAISVGVRHVEPVALASVRFATAAGIFCLWRARHWVRPASWQDAGRICLCGVLGIALYNVLLNTGQRSVPPGAASFIIATQPIFAAALSALLGHERLTIRTLSGSAVSLLGVAIISLGLLASWRLGHGAAFVVAAAACSGSYFVLQRPLVLRYGAITAASWTILVGAVLLLPWLPQGIAQTARSGEAIVAVGFLALGAGVLAYTLWMSALAGLGAARAANLLFLMAPLATALSALTLGSRPGMPTLIGGALALLGVAIVNHGYRHANPQLAGSFKPTPLRGSD